MADGPPPPPRKVLVSGCFDLLHSGHIEFFKEAAALGELHVRLGSDANIRALKDHAPMYSDAERLFMVRSIACVHDAALSAGTGRFDFVEDARRLKPDVYFVNDDASKLEERAALMAELGVEMVVQRRAPAAGLEERSSTSMKARLRDLVAEEERAAARQALPMAAFNETLPWRFCFAGGWMDLKWVNAWAAGCAITINVKFSPRICKDECGLATSSRKVAARLWNGRAPSWLGPEAAAKMLYGAENFEYFGDESRPYSAGSQDHCGLMFPGVNKLCYAGGLHWPRRIVNLNDPSDPAQAAIFEWLERVLHIVEIPFVSRPDGYSSQRVNHLLDDAVPDAEKRRLVAPLADASERAWAAIVARDSAALGRALSDTMGAWGGMLPYTLDPYLAIDDEKSAQLKAFVARYDAPHTRGCLFSGAGGGFLMVISDEPVEGGMKIEINHDPIVLPHPSDHL